MRSMLRKQHETRSMTWESVKSTNNHVEMLITIHAYSTLEQLRQFRKAIIIEETPCSLCLYIVVHPRLWMSLPHHLPSVLSDSTKSHQQSAPSRAT